MFDYCASEIENTIENTPSAAAARRGGWSAAQGRALERFPIKRDRKIARSTCFNASSFSAKSATWRDDALTNCTQGAATSRGTPTSMQETGRRRLLGVVKRRSCCHPPTSASPRAAFEGGLRRIRLCRAARSPWRRHRSRSRRHVARHNRARRRRTPPPCAKGALIRQRRASAVRRLASSPHVAAVARARFEGASAMSLSSALATRRGGAPPPRWRPHPHWRRRSANAWRSPRRRTPPAG